MTYEDMIYRFAIGMFGMGYFTCYFLAMFIKTLFGDTYIKGYKDGIDAARKIVSGECDCDHNRCRKKVV